jgi:hypothetical protein
MLLLAVSSLHVFAEEDPYLSAISQEAKKVVVPSQPDSAEPGESATPLVGELDLRAFEEDLKARYKGSYTFYTKLPRRTQDEIFLEYRDGASMDEIRKKIMDRFLHQ